MLKKLILSFGFILVSFHLVANDELTQFENKITHLKGNVIYVDFWASWCIPCKDSFPWLNSLQQQYSSQGFTVVSVNLDAKKSNAESFLLELPASFPVIYDPKGKIARAFKLKGMPSSLIINRNGKVVNSHVGFNAEKKIEYQREIVALIKSD